MSDAKTLGSDFGRIDRVIWAVDAFEPPGLLLENAAALIRGLRQRANTRIKPVYVLSPAELNLPLDYSGRVIDQYSPGAHAALANLLGRLGFEGLEAPEILLQEVHSTVHAADALSDFAVDRNADAIVLSTHGRSGVKRILLGSFAETLLLRSRVPVVVVSPEARPRPTVLRRILFPSELSRSARPIYGGAVALARRLGASLTLFHEIPHPIEPVFQSGVYLLGGGWIPVQAYFTGEQERKERRARAWARWARQRGVRADTVIHPAAGQVALQILELARERQVDLIAMAAFSGALSAALVGSITRAVVRHAPCPVWVMGPKVGVPSRGLFSLPARAA